MIGALIQLPTWAIVVIVALVVIDTLALAIILRRVRAKLGKVAAAAIESSPVVPDRSAMWFYASQGTAVGPYTYDQLVEMARGGMFSPQDMVCTEKDHRWIAAGRVRGLFSEEQ